MFPISLCVSKKNKKIMATVSKKKSNKKLYWILGGTIAVLLTIAAIKGRGEKKGEKIYAEKAQKRTIVQLVSASGRIFPEKEIKISSDVSGQLVELTVKEGDSVKAGQLLARVNPETYQNQIERGEASVNASRAQQANAQAQIENIKARLGTTQAQREQIEAQLVNTRNAFKRNEKLHHEGVVSDADFEQTQSQLRQQEANLKQIDATLSASISEIKSSEESAKAAEYNVRGSEASLKEMKTALNKTSIYAPANGIVSKLNVEKGERVVGTAQMSGTEMMRLANMNSMEVQVNISENDILRVSVGNEVEIDVAAYQGRKFKGRVTEIANTAANATTASGQLNLTTDQVTNFVVKIRIDAASYSDLMQNGKSPFRPGMSADVNIRTNTVGEALSIPIQAVTTRDEKKEEAAKKPQKEGETEKISNIPVQTVVFVCSADTVKQVEVKTGIQDNDFIQITSGLKEGDEVVAEPYNAIARKLKTGMKVEKTDKKSLYKNNKKPFES
jgi:HlyD family secretion protein